MVPLNQTNRRAYTITEAIIASFLLLTAILVASRLFHASLRYSVWVENKAVATHLAERRMAELRRWAMTQTDWSSPPTGNFSDFSAFTIHTTISETQLMSPSKELEAEYPGKERLMERSLRQAIVEVEWDNNNKITLVSILRDPPRPWRLNNPIVITGIPGSTVGPSDAVTLVATGYDSFGKEIKDLCFSWAVEPVWSPPALGTITPARDGRTATFRNRRMTPTGPVASAGKCRVRATTVHHGEERSVWSNSLNLAP